MHHSPKRTLNRRLKRLLHKIWGWGLPQACHRWAMSDERWGMAGFKNEQLWRIRITVNTFCYRDITGIRKISSAFFASSNYYHNLAGSRSSRPATLPFRNAEIRIWIALEFLCTGSDTPVRSKSYGIGKILPAAVESGIGILWYVLSIFVM